MASSSDEKIIKLPKITDPRGNLSFIQAPEHVPFEIARCYWVYDVPSGQRRDGHAYYTSTEMIVALSGALDVTVDNGVDAPRAFRLTNPCEGLIVPPMHWRSIENFSTNAVAMVLASTLYDDTDYITDYSQFKEIAANDRPAYDI